MVTLNSAVDKKVFKDEILSRLGSRSTVYAVPVLPPFLGKRGNKRCNSSTNSALTSWHMVTFSLAKKRKKEETKSTW